MTVNHDIAGPALAVIDTNVLLDWLVFDEPSVRPVVRALTSDRLKWLSTEAMLTEQRHVFGQLALSPWQADPLALAGAYLRWATVVPAPPSPGPLICTDPSDQMFIDLALGCRANWLLTHDRALLRLARRARKSGVEVVTPKAWASIQGPEP